MANPYARVTDAKALLGRLLASGRTVRQHLVQCWSDNFGKNKKESGGWILRVGDDGGGGGDSVLKVKMQLAKYTTPTAVMIKPASNYLNDDEMSRLVADFHTHPGFDTMAARPSGTDIENSNVPYLVLLITIDKRAAKGFKEEAEQLFFSLEAGTVTVDKTARKYRIWLVRNRDAVPIAGAGAGRDVAPEMAGALPAFTGSAALISKLGMFEGFVIIAVVLMIVMGLNQIIAYFKGGWRKEVKRADVVSKSEVSGYRHDWNSDWKNGSFLDRKIPVSVPA